MKLLANLSILVPRAVERVPINGLRSLQDNPVFLLHPRTDLESIRDLTWGYGSPESTKYGAMLFTPALGRVMKVHDLSNAASFVAWRRSLD